jgi:hypothetical protein
VSQFLWQYEDVRLEWDLTLLRLSDRGTHEAVLLTVDEARALRDWLNANLADVLNRLAGNSTGDT